MRLDGPYPRTRRLIASAAAAAVLAASGCSADEEAGTESGASSAELFGHVHGLGVDPGDGTLYVASHFGVYRVPDGAPPERVAGRWQDTMAFAVAGPGNFLASGHPDVREDLPPHLGLIESEDGAETWRSVSLRGRADFHALEAAEGRLWGFDSVSGELLTSTTGGRTWDSLGQHRVADLAADPTSPHRVLATAPNGLQRFDASSSDGGSPVPVAGAPALLLVDWPEVDLLLGVAVDGRVYRSEDSGGSWLLAGEVPGDPHAFDADADAWHVATDRGLYRSTDEGRSWEPLLD